MKYFGGKIFSIFILGFLLCPGFFIAEKCLAGSAVVINEIAWMGSEASANNEWIELKNLGGADINLAGWTLGAADGAPEINMSGTILAGGYFLLERTSDNSVPGIVADLIFTGSLGNNGELFELKDSGGDMVDKVEAANGWPAGDNDTKQTMERKNDGTWQTSMAAGGTPKAANSGELPEIPPVNQDSSEKSQGIVSDSSGGGSDSSVIVGFPYRAVIINEFVSEPNSGEVEWIELYNPQGKELSLDGWTIVDGSGVATVLSGGFNEDDYYFFVAEKPKGVLNNSGDEIVLLDRNQDVIDKVSYGKFGNQPDKNAPAPGKGESVALKIDGQKGLSDKDGFAISTAPTKGTRNIVAAPENSEEAAVNVQLEKIAITEIMPNPIGSDTDGEFIELFNSSDKEIDLTGYRVEVENGRVFEFGKFLNITKVLPVSGYFTLYRFESNLILDNNGGRLRLFAPNKSKAAQALEYSQAPEGASFCDMENIDLKNISSSTKNFLHNSLMAERWVWSEEPTPGRANQIKLANRPPKIIFSAPEKILTGKFISFDASDSYDENGDALAYVWDFGDAVPINLQAPTHVFYKPGNYKVKLTISDGQGSSVLEKIFKITGDDLSVKTDSAANKNPIILPNNPTATKGGMKKFLPDVKAAGFSSVNKPVVVKKTISKAKLNSPWKVSGTVIALPGTFGVQYFYASVGSSTPAVKIYNYYKDFPVLAIGDLITVSGVVGGSNTDKYLKTKSSVDIKILGKGAVEAEKIKASDFREDNLGKLVSIAGDIESKGGVEIILSDETGKVNLYLKSSAKIDSKRIKVGQNITATGLLAKVSGSLAVLPRGDYDLIIATSSKSTESGFVLGAATSSNFWTLSARESKGSPLAYGLIVAGGAVIISAGFLAKKYLVK